MRSALTIAGSDSSAGAGVQADLKTFAAHGIYGVSAITSVTAQNTSGICGVVDLPPEFVRSQIEALAEDIEIVAVKTGMLANAGIVSAVAEIIRQLRLPMVVVDPVLTAGDGRPLLAPDAIAILKTVLFPLAEVVTPNTVEAGQLADIRVGSLEDAREAASRIHALGPHVVIVKGGHLEGDHAIDVFYDGRTFTELAALRIAGSNLHGTGCTFAAAVAANLALGHAAATAAEKAKAYVTGAIEHGLRIGRGRGLLDHFWNQRLYS